MDFKQLDTYLMAAQLSGKYVLIFDQTDSVASFMEYKHILKDLHKEVLNVRLGA